MIRALLACLTILVVLAVGTDLGQFVRTSRGAATLCCCGPAGDGHACECTGPCCDHAPRRARDRSVAGFDDHCGARQATSPAGTTLEPGMPPVTRMPRPAAGASRLAALHEPPALRAFAAPPEPPPRTRAA